MHLFFLTIDFTSTIYKTFQSWGLFYKSYCNNCSAKSLPKNRHKLFDIILKLFNFLHFIMKVLSIEIHKEKNNYSIHSNHDKI